MAKKKAPPTKKAKGKASAKQAPKAFKPMAPNPGAPPSPIARAMQPQGRSMPPGMGGAGC
jgi:hypothetical protein